MQEPEKAAFERSLIPRQSPQRIHLARIVCKCGGESAIRAFVSPVHRQQPGLDAMQPSPAPKAGGNRVSKRVFECANPHSFQGGPALESRESRTDVPDLAAGFEAGLRLPGQQQIAAIKSNFPLAARRNGAPGEQSNSFREADQEQDQSAMRDLEVRELTHILLAFIGLVRVLASVALSGFLTG
jgi:hypothetical protein